MASLYNTWRPQTFADVVGQEHIVRTLRNALARPDHLAHAYLFTGPRGTGKTTTARLLAKAVNCQQGMQPEPCDQCEHCSAIKRGAQLDLLIEIDAASNTGVDDIRELRERVGRRPAEGRYKVYIIDEVHMLSNSAFNALLKTLEEPPPHVIFVLATTDPQKVPPTVLSRCQRFDFKPVAATALVRHLRTVGEREKIAVDDTALEFIARLATGSVRDALSLLDQAASFAGQTINVGHLQDMLGLSDQALVLAMADALLDGDLAAALTTLQTVSDRGADLREFGRQLVGFLRALLLARSGVSTPAGQSLSEEEQEAVRARSRRADLPALVRWLRLFTEADQGLRSTTVQPQLPLELAAVQSLVAVSDAAPTAAPAAAAAGVSAPPVSSAAQPASTGATDAAASAHPVAESEPTRAETAAPPADATPREPAPQQSDRTTPAPPVAPSPAPAAAQPADGSVPAAAGPLSVATIESRWPAVFELLGRKRKVTALLRDARIAAVQADEVTLEFDHRFHAEQIEKPENRLVTEQALQRVFGQPLRTRVVVKGAAERSVVAASPERADPVVRHALAVFPGATIIDEAADGA